MDSGVAISGPVSGGVSATYYTGSPITGTTYTYTSSYNCFGFVLVNQDNSPTTSGLTLSVSALSVTL